MSIRKIGLIVLIVFSIGNKSTVVGQTSDLIEKVCVNLNLNLKDIYLDLVCEKVMPNFPSRTIIAMPKIAEKGEGYITFDSYILVVDNSTGLVLSKFFENDKTSGWMSDAVYIESIKIDTAPYKLNDSSRAFGIRVRYSGSSRVNPYEMETLSLFVAREDSLIAVLDKYKVLQYRGEWDGTCEGEFINQKKILIVSSEKTNEFSDILIKNNITRTKNKYENNDCVEQEEKSIERTILKFNGTEYIHENKK